MSATLRPSGRQRVTSDFSKDPASTFIAALRRRPWLSLLISALLLIPCVWHRHIEAGDLGSHTYNAWLAQLIERGQAPGLFTVWRWDNVLVDFALLHATKALGFVAGEKLVVAACVLVFFWGVFSFVAAVTGRAPWLLTPAIAMLTYGYAFNLGFLNYCVSLGLSCLALSFVWRTNARAGNWLACAVVAFLAMLAHPIGFLFLLGMIAYRFACELLSTHFKWLVPLFAISAFVALRLFLAHQRAWSVDWSRDEPFYFYNGADQLIIYGERYAKLAFTAALFGLASLIAGLVLRKKDELACSLVPSLELYAVAFIAIALLPENIQPSPGSGWIGLLVSRLTVIPAIFGLCALASLPPRAWHFAGFMVATLVFFGFLYSDTRWLNRMETEAEVTLSQLPFGTRIIPTVVPPPGWRAQFIGHLADRACIGHCFTYSNYEAPTGQFRIGVSPQGSALVTRSSDDAEDMSGGAYEVQDTDPPLKQLYQCDLRDLTKLCLHDLQPGDNTGTLMLRLP